MCVMEFFVALIMKWRTPRLAERYRVTGAHRVREGSDSIAVTLNQYGEAAARNRAPRYLSVGMDERKHRERRADKGSFKWEV
jgi:hypothetical protein